MEHAEPIDQRTEEEREAGKARMGAWLAGLAPPYREFYERLKERDPKGKVRG